MVEMTMNHYIECSRAIDVLIKNTSLEGREYEEAENAMRAIPAADVQPVVHGQWEVDGHHIRCSMCGEYMCRKDREGAEIPRKYCPNCGCAMDGGPDDV